MLISLRVTMVPRMKIGHTEHLLVNYSFQPRANLYYFKTGLMLTAMIEPTYQLH